MNPSSPRLSGLSASFPAHNEEDNVVPMIDELLAALPQVAEEFEIIVVDDGSRDRTRERAEERARTDPRIRVVHHPVNRGYGAAVWSGLTAGRMPYAFFTDGDRQFDVRQIATLLPQIEGHDAVIGWRVNRQDPLIRRINAHLWNALVRLTFGLAVRDVDCAFKLFRRDILEGLEIHCGGATFSTELLTRVQRRGGRLAQVPVLHRPRTSGAASGGSPRVILRAFRELARLRVELWREAPTGRH